ncbi:hypothetical protein [Fodinicola feengrottensis]|uniref:Uncharacterized protein n=1 Tax=Fodinicola feengrottensis TaxID=435914 RepID=A0ABN2IM00_9ACTN|nr:hypothetical protein [Fodinicola feengrottensis]
MSKTIIASEFSTAVSETALPDEVEPTSIYPTNVVKGASTTKNGLKYLDLGEDGDHLIILGPPTMAEITAAMHDRAVALGLSDDDVPDAHDFRYTYVRELTLCRDHSTFNAECTRCRLVDDFGSWFDLSGPDERLADPTQADYFPTALWSSFQAG